MGSPKLRMQALGLLIGYGLQFLAGMLLNLFVTIEVTHPGSTGSEYFSRSWHSFVWSLSGHGGWELSFHAYLALLLVLGSIALFVRATVMRNKGWAITGGISALFTLGAFFNGMSFVDYNKDISSMIMATCWLVAVGTLVFGISKFSNQSAKKHLHAS